MLKKVGLFLLVIGFAQAASAGWLKEKCEGFLERHIVADDPYELPEDLPQISSPALAKIQVNVGTMIKEYRTLGGKLYWSTGKISSGYANDVDKSVHEVNAAYLFALGQHLRQLLFLSPPEAEMIEFALSDYAQFERQ